MAASKRLVDHVYRLRHAGESSGWGYLMPSDGPKWFATRKDANAYAAKLARNGGAFKHPFDTTVELLGPNVGWASSDESREANLREAERDLGVKFRRTAKRARKKVANPSRKRKAAPKRKIAASYTVSIFDPEAGHFVRYSRMKGASARDVERRVMAKWGLDADDVKVTKPTAKKAR